MKVCRGITSITTQEAQKTLTVLHLWQTVLRLKAKGVASEKRIKCADLLSTMAKQSGLNSTAAFAAVATVLLQIAANFVAKAC